MVNIQFQKLKDLFDGAARIGLISSVNIPGSTDLTQDQITQLLKSYIDRQPEDKKDLIRTTEYLNSNYSKFINPVSKEAVVLGSLSFTSIGLILLNTGLGKAIKSGHRAEAFYEIRYNTNRNRKVSSDVLGKFTKENVDLYNKRIDDFNKRNPNLPPLPKIDLASLKVGDPLPPLYMLDNNGNIVSGSVIGVTDFAGNTANGIAKRRYYELQQFGLYDDENNITISAETDVLATYKIICNKSKNMTIHSHRRLMRRIGIMGRVPSRPRMIY